MPDNNMPDLGSLMNMAQQLQGDMTKIQEDLARTECKGTAGGGMVTATVNGQYDLVALEIDKQVVDPEDVGMLQDLVVAAVNQAMVKMRELTQSEMAKLTGNLNIPGLPNLGNLF